jgi:hypothetical protein
MPQISDRSVLTLHHGEAHFRIADHWATVTRSSIRTQL